MLKKIEDGILFLLVIALATLPLLFKLLQDGLHVPISGSDVFLVHLVFLYACFAGGVTWLADRHISLASLTKKLPARLQLPLSALCTGETTAFLVALFFDGCCQLFNPDNLQTTVFKIPLRTFFAFLPLCYGGILIVVLRKARKSRWLTAAAALGALFGIFAASGSIAGVFYYLCHWESLVIFTPLSQLWISFCERFFLLLILFTVATAFLGMPLFVVLGLVSYYAFSFSGGYVDVIPLETYRILTDKSVAAIPLFTIAGYILARGSAGSRFIALFSSLCGWFRGGTVVASVIVIAFFTTFTGVSGVTILALGPLLALVLTGSGYTDEKTQSLITACGSLGLMFPPSVAIIMYATTNYFSVDAIELFKGALLPGLWMTAAMVAMGVFFDKQKVRPPFSAKKIFLSMKDCLWELFLPVGICCGYFSGFVDLFETAAFAVVYTYCITVFIRKDFSVKDSFRIIGESVPVAGGVLFILGAASGLSYYMLDADIPGSFTYFITGHVTSKYVFLMLMNLLLLLVGCLMDMYSAILIVSPLLLPIAESFGISAVQAGVIFLLNLSIGFLTPPVGMDLFIASYTFKRPLGKIVRGVLPFLGVQLLVLLFVTYMPWLSL